MPFTGNVQTGVRRVLSPLVTSSPSNTANFHLLRFTIYRDEHLETAMGIGVIENHLVDKLIRNQYTMMLSMTYEYEQRRPTSHELEKMAQLLVEEYPPLANSIDNGA